MQLPLAGRALGVPSAYLQCAYNYIIWGPLGSRCDRSLGEEPIRNDRIFVVAPQTPNDDVIHYVHLYDTGVLLVTLEISMHYIRDCCAFCLVFTTLICTMTYEGPPQYLSASSTAQLCC